MNSRRQGWVVLLTLPYIAVLWVGSYNFTEPGWFGFPFFYWYQLAWVPLCSLLVLMVYLLTAPRSAKKQ